MMLFLNGCTSSIKLETNGVSVPNYVAYAELPGNNMSINTTLVCYYKIKEGKEFLDAFKYLNPMENCRHKIRHKGLEKLYIKVYVLNPTKKNYQVWLHQSTSGSELDSKHKLIYNGSLSRKIFDMDLTTTENTKGLAYYSLRSSQGDVVFCGPLIRYSMVSERDSKDNLNNAK